MLADLADLSLEQLSDIVVTSVSRREEPLLDAPASIFVITSEDIRRSGATTLPEALRLAPNLLVARADANQYAISARGFNNVLANKLLVLIDGRTVYTPLFSGVFWEAQDLMLEDVDRIEVISGPGTTLWGANAVNGVINVITRAARDTQGALAAAGFGNFETSGAARYGGELGTSGHYRLYAKLLEREPTERANGSQVRDAANRVQAGLRADWDAGADGFTLQGDAYNGNIDQLPAGRDIAGVNLLGRWTHRFANGSSVRVQGYYDRTERHHPGVFREVLDIFDLELQHALRPIGAHTVVWGGGYRHAQDDVDNGPLQAFLPPDRDLQWSNLFVQDQIALTRKLDLIVGLKAETNVYTDTELLPNVRAAWRFAPNYLAWAAVSRAVRAPSRIDREFFIPAAPPFVLAGGPGFDAETAIVYELGYRAQPARGLSLSVTAFHHDFDRLRSIRPAVGGSVLENDIEGTTSGVEAWASLRVTPAWRLSGGVVFMDQDLRVKAGQTDAGGLAALGNDPDHWWTLRSSLDLTERHALDAQLRHVAALPAPRVPSYTALDMRLAWRPNPRLELSFTVQNLLDPAHPEWGPAPNRAEIERTFFLKLLWRS